MPFAEGIPTVEVHLDKPRPLAFTLGAMRRVQERAGTLEVLGEDAADLLALPIYIWSCMDAEGRAALTVEDVEDMIHPGNMVAINRAVMGLLGASTPEAAAGAGADPTQAGPKSEASG